MCGRLPRLKKVNLSVGNLRKTPAGGAGTKGKPPIICICNRLEATEAVWVVCHYSQSTSSGTRDPVRSPLPAVGALSLKRLIGLKRRGMIFNHESKRRLTRSGDRDHAAMLNTRLTSEASWSTTVEPVGCWRGGGGGCSGNRTRAFSHQWRHTEIPSKRQNYFPPRRCRRSFRPIRSRSEFRGTRLAEHHCLHSSAGSAPLDAHKLKIGGIPVTVCDRSGERVR